MRHADLIGCHMHNVDFAKTNLEKANFKESDLSHAIFEQSNLQKCDFSQAFHYQIDPTQNSVKGTKISIQEARSFLAFFALDIVD
jgi:uncharacterized protein YjbI with pentapeptide repeats